MEHSYSRQAHTGPATGLEIRGEGASSNMLGTIYPVPWFAAIYLECQI